MPKLTEKEREGFKAILKSDLRAINQRFISQIKDFWTIARARVLEIKGWDKLIQEKQLLEKQQKRIKEQIHEIENVINSEPLRAEQIIELGGKPNEYGRCEGANFYGIPVTSQFDIDLEVPSKILRDVCESSIRALVMAGTFEEARGAYEKFYSLDFQKYGVDIPPRLEELCKDKKTMLYAQQSLQQIERGKPDIKMIEGGDQG